ncbi:MAG: substrate-binding domain-containing protein [Rhodobacteraceae bacterium]|nr:substrate-binding domain-containing protein [Paracoccaceae bacterium]
MKLRYLGNSILFGLAVIATPAISEQVTLSAADGSSTITGEFIDFEDGFYTINTTIGQMRLPANTVSCAGAACPQLEVFEVDATIVGSGSVAEGLMPLLIAGYADSLAAESEAQIGSNPQEVSFLLTSDGGFGDPVGSFLVVSQTAGAGFDALLNDDAQIAISSRRIHKDEARALRNSGAGNMVSFDQEHVIAVDSLLIIVHPSNPINEISLVDVEKIYAGEITNWAELGGLNQQIIVHSYAEDSGTWEYFDDHVLHGAPIDPEHWSIQSSEEEMAREINRDLFSIGYVGHAFQRGAKALNFISSCGIVSVPDTFSAKTEDYPLERRIYAYNRADSSSDAVKKLLAYAISSESDGVIAKAGFIDLSVARVQQSTVEGRMQELLKSVNDPYELLLMRDMILEMIEWDRLSTTFRFGAGSSRLDNKAELDMNRLVDYLERQPEGTLVSTVGFTDSDGAFSGNQSLSENRAGEVLNTIQQHANGRLNHLVLSAQGFGELSPASCNDSSDGKRLNRRVEIWIQN